MEKPDGKTLETEMSNKNKDRSGQSNTNSSSKESIIVDIQDCSSHIKSDNEHIQSENGDYENYKKSRKDSNASSENDMSISSDDQVKNIIDQSISDKNTQFETKSQDIHTGNADVLPQSKNLPTVPGTLPIESRVPFLVHTKSLHTEPKDFSLGSKSITVESNLGKEVNTFPIDSNKYHKNKVFPSETISFPVERRSSCNDISKKGDHGAIRSCVSSNRTTSDEKRKYNLGYNDSSSEEINSSKNLPSSYKNKYYKTNSEYCDAHKRNEKVTLTSRGNKKRVTIDERSTVVDVDPVVNCIDFLQNRFLAGVAELREEVEKLKSEKQSYQEEIKNLENNVYRLSQEKEQYKNVICQLENGLEVCTQRYEDRLKETNLKHKEQMDKFARKMGENFLANKTLSKWKLKTFGTLTSQKTKLELLKENKKLHDELLLCQESAKNAFIRSATVLNSEALTMFQDAATRRIIGIEDINNIPNESDPEDSPSDHQQEKSCGEYNKENKLQEKSDYVRTNNIIPKANYYHKEKYEHLETDKLNPNSNCYHNEEHRYTIPSSGFIHQKCCEPSYFSKCPHSTTYCDGRHKRLLETEHNFEQNIKGKKLISNTNESVPHSLRAESRACLEQLKTDKLKFSRILQDNLSEKCEHHMKEVDNKGSKCIIKSKNSSNKPKRYDYQDKTSHWNRTNQSKSIVYRPTASTIIIEKHLKK